MDDGEWEYTLNGGTEYFPSQLIKIYIEKESNSNQGKGI